MHSRRDYIVTKDEVYGYANEWLTVTVKVSRSHLAREGAEGKRRGSWR
jgi:hypothetical protein